MSKINLTVFLLLVLTTFQLLAAAPLFTVESLSRDEACNSAVDEAAEAGYEISKFDCYCNESPTNPKKTVCILDSEGAKRIKPTAKKLSKPKATGVSPANAKKTEEFSLVAAASAATKDRACTLAKELFAEEDRSPNACNCTSYKKATFFVCKAQGRDKSHNNKSPISHIKDLIKEVTTCNPLKDEKKCERVRRNVGTGVRG